MAYRPPEKWTYESCYEEAKKYTTRSEFKKGCECAYDKSRKMNWIDDYTWLAAPSNKKYTYDEVKLIAEQYDSLAEFTKNSVGAYQAALKNGWLDSFTHLKRRNKDLTAEDIIERAKQFSSYKEFINSNESLYNAFLKFYNSGKISDNDLPWEVTKRKSEWTHEDCYNEAKKYDSSWHFKLGNESAYNRARIEGWLDEYTWFRNPKAYTFEECEELAKDFDAPYAFAKAHPGAYGAAKNNGWLDKLDFPNRVHEWTKEEVIERCSKYGTKRDTLENDKRAYYAFCRFRDKGILSDEDMNWQPAERTRGDESDPIHSVYVYDFGDNTAYVGRTMNPKKRDSQHRRPHHAHGRSDPDSVLQHSIDTGLPIPEMVILEEGLDMQESRRQEDSWYNAYKDLGYTMLNKGATGEYVGSVGGFSVKWTRERVTEFAKKFNTVNDMLNEDESAYRAMMRYKLADELFPNRRFTHKWSFDEVKEAASKYPTRTRFQKLDQNMYYIARKNGWLDILFPKKEKPQENQTQLF